MATEAPAARTPTDHRTAYPGGGASKKFMAVASPFFQPARSPKQHDLGIDPKNKGYSQDFDSCADAVVPRVVFYGFLRPPKKTLEWYLASLRHHTKEKAGGGAHATTHAVVLGYCRRFLSAGRCVTCCYSDFIKKSRTLVYAKSGSRTRDTLLWRVRAKCRTIFG